MGSLELPRSSRLRGHRGSRHNSSTVLHDTAHVLCVSVLTVVHALVYACYVHISHVLYVHISHVLYVHISHVLYVHISHVLYVHISHVLYVHISHVLYVHISHVLYVHISHVLYVTCHACYVTYCVTSDIISPSSPSSSPSLSSSSSYMTQCHVTCLAYQLVKPVERP